jgi:hypothetical protein
MDKNNKLTMKIILILTIINILLNMTLAQSKSCISKYSKLKGTCMNPYDCEGAILNNLCTGSLKCCIPETDGNSQQNFITKTDLENVFGLTNSPRLKYIAKILSPPLQSYTCNQKAAYLSQLAHETGNFRLSEEEGQTSYFEKYEYNTTKGKELGNIDPGDGMLILFV